jgi:hypothetical protein
VSEANPGKGNLMPLILLGSDQAMQLCGSDLTGPVNSPPITSLAKELDLRKYVLEVAAWASNSRTAKEILYVVQNCEPNIYFVGMNGGGFSCFNSDYPKFGSGTVYYNLALKMEIGFNGPGPTETASNFAAGPKRNVSLHNYVGFLHELGHAKQFIENQGFFRESMDKKASDELRKNQGLEPVGKWGGGNWAYMADGKFRSEVETKAKELAEKQSPLKKDLMPGAGGQGSAWKNLKLQQVRMCKPQWGVRIETDNLMRHEWPICEEFKLPKRNYTDLVVTAM